MKVTKVKSLYLSICPNCGGPIDSRRLEKGLPCEKCLRNMRVRRGEVIKVLANSGTLKALREVADLEEKVKKLSELFEKLVGKPWGAQRSWIKRFVRGDSFSIVAPTGTGKSVFGLVASIYKACVEKRKAYFIVPTSTLVKEFTERLEDFVRRSGCELKVVSYSKGRKKEKVLREIADGKFDILITTVAFSRKHADLLAAQGFGLLFVDDVDAVLKSNRSVKVVLKIAGFKEEDVRKGEELLQLQRRARRESAEELYEREERLREEMERIRKSASQLVVSSATGRPTAAAARLFRVLLGFEAGGAHGMGLRNVVDTYKLVKGDLFREAVLYLYLLGDGTLVFVSKDLGVEGAERLAEMLRKAGIAAEAVHSKKSFDRSLERFKSGELKVLVGVADYYGLLVRGIDLPHRVKHSLFVGVPKIILRVGAERPSPINLLRVLSLLSTLSIEEVAEGARRKLGELRRIMRRFSAAYLQEVARKVEKGEQEESAAYRVLAEVHKFTLEALRREDVWAELRRRKDVSVEEHEGQKYIRIADVATYIQASGRTSRLYAGGITKGLSIVLVDDEAVFNDLARKLRRIAEIEWKELSQVELEKVLKEIERERKKMRVKKKSVGLMRSALLVVESPNKARIIASFFGRPAVRVMPNGLRVYEVSLPTRLLMIAASGGHIFDLTQNLSSKDVLPSLSRYENFFGILVKEKGKDGFVPVFAPRKRCLSCGYQFSSSATFCIRCGSKRLDSSTDVIADLRRIAWEVDEVFIGTDPDTEGEKIGWDLYLAISPFNSNVQRIEFHEVTREEILKALQQPRSFDEKLVGAQMVRRVEDRWIGFTLSPLLWCLFWPKYCSEEKLPQSEAKVCKRKYNYSLSAGRVQTPVLGWVIERAAEHKKKVDVFLLTFNEKSVLSFREGGERGIPPEKAEILRQLLGKKRRVETEVRITLKERRELEVSPLPPYTTDTMLADANRYLRMGAEEAMRLAQDLFTWGLITYHRTDSTRVSEKGQQIARQWLQEKFGDYYEELMELRGWGEGGAHEAIRITRPLDRETLELYIEEGLIEIPEITSRHLDLYDMIFRRFIASQMKRAIVEEGLYMIEILGERRVELEERRIIRLGKEPAQGEQLSISAGFTLVWNYGLRPRPLEEGVFKALLQRRRVGKVSPMAQGELVEHMKRKGIGRPSTYAKIVETLIRRRYVLTPRRAREYLVATRRGEMVYRFLTKEIEEIRSEVLGDEVKKVPSLISEERTKSLEKAMDEVERGEKSWLDVMEELYEEIKELSRPIRHMMSNVKEGEEGRGLGECLRGARDVFGEENQEG
ncbi:MAG: reverse gyrase [Acidilobaceae archaeon]|nr:reverse gyrase [Acidilobaceae archaeon]